MFYTSILCLLIILSCCSESQSAKRHFNLELRNVTCSSFTDIVRLVDCDVRKLAENRFGMDVMFYLNRPVPLDADIEILLHYRVPKSTRVVSFINIKMKICDILQHATTVPIVKEVLNGLARFSNLPLTCPVKGNVMYNVTNLIITDSICPLYSPIVDFNLTVNFYEVNQICATYFLQGATTRKTKM